MQPARGSRVTQEDTLRNAMRDQQKSARTVGSQAAEIDRREKRQEQADLDSAIGRWVNEGGLVKGEEPRGAPGARRERHGGKARRRP